ncbi:MAG: hypothetical protein HY675_20205 [Chloroflexi bacterium]|nr:hypothetical protein [Chloroflexota bacterium]
MKVGQVLLTEDGTRTLGMALRCCLRVRSNQRLLLCLLLAAFFSIASLYSVLNPVFEAPDELWHFLHVKYVADHRALIVQSSDPLQNPARQEGSQPPLYYLVGAAFTGWIDTGPPSGVAILNRYAEPGRPMAKTNQNLVIHTASEAFPYRGVSLAVHLLRLISIIMATATILAVFLTAATVLPAPIALGTAAAAAYIPQFVFVAASVNNDNLMNLLSALLVLQLVSLLAAAVREPGIGNQSGIGQVIIHQPPPLRLLLLGITLGLVLLSKLHALGLVPLTLLVLGALAIRYTSWRFAVKSTVVVLGTAAAVSGWWYLRNWSLYGDPLGLRAFLWSQLVDDLNFDLAEVLIRIGWAKSSFWALFGWSNVPVEPYIYWFFDALAFASILGLLLWWRRRWPPLARADLLVACIPVGWSALLVLAFLPWMAVTQAGTGRLLFASLTGISMVLVFGLVQLVPARIVSPLLIVIAMAMFAVSSSLPFLTIAPTYARASTLLGPEAAALIPRRVNINYDNQLVLLGYKSSSEVLRPGRRTEFTVFWRSLGKKDETEYGVAIAVLAGGRELVGKTDDLLVVTGQPLREMNEKGAILRRTYAVDVDMDASPSLAQLNVSVYHQGSMKRLPAYDELMRPLGEVPIMGDIAISE